MIWESFNVEQRLTAVTIDITNEPRFCGLAGIGMIGEMLVVDDAAKMPTAATNGRDEYYGRAFMAQQSRKQARYVKLHEVLHKRLLHCINYPVVTARYPEESNKAMDYVVNGIIEMTDPQHSFIDHPHGVKPLLDPAYYGMSFLDVLRLLIKPGQQKQQQPGDQGQAGDGQPGDAGQPMDKHIPGADDLSVAEQAEVAEEIESAARQGAILQSKMAGSSGGGSALDNAAQERDTNWREHLADFVREAFQGDDMSRLCPPNRIMQASGHLMWSHFTEQMGELAILCDTSGSMGHIYPVIFGEIANICRAVNPESVRVIWWDTKVRGEQVFTPDQYDQIATMLAPKGGGGTTPHVVAQYITQKGYTPQAAVWLTDGYLDGSAHLDCPVLWGVIDNKRFVPSQGMAVHIDSMREMR